MSAHFMASIGINPIKKSDRRVSSGVWEKEKQPVVCPVNWQEGSWKWRKVLVSQSSALVSKAETRTAVLQTKARQTNHSDAMQLCFPVFCWINLKLRICNQMKRPWWIHRIITPSASLTHPARMLEAFTGPQCSVQGGANLVSFSFLSKHLKTGSNHLAFSVLVPTYPRPSQILSPCIFQSCSQIILVKIENLGQECDMYL